MTMNRDEAREIYDFVGEFKEGFARVGKDGKEFHVRRDYKPAYEARFHNVGFFSEGLASACEKRDGKEFHIRPDGTPAYPQRFDSVSPFYNGRARVTLKKESFSIQSDGKSVF